MKTYFIIENSKQIESLSKDDLKNRNITKETPIWREGLTDWTTAGELPELSDLFIATPPPFNDRKQQMPPPRKEFVNTNAIPEKKKNKRLILWIVIGLVIVFVILVGMRLAYHYSAKNNYTAEYDYQIKTIRLNEEATPSDYLKTIGSFEFTDFEDAYVITGKIENTAVMTSYKDVEFQITYYDENGEIVDYSTVTLDQEFQVQSTSDFSIRVPIIERSATCGIELTNATVYK